MRILLSGLLLFAALAFAAPDSAQAACGCSNGRVTSDSQGYCLKTRAPNGRTDADITWRFSSAVECAELYPADGLGINWAVSSAATLTSIQPNYQSSPARHGAVFNPTTQNAQAFDSRITHHEPERNVSFPFTPNTEGSLIKSVSEQALDPGDRVYLLFAGVLTFLDSMPSNPHQVFRPPYYGTYKPIFRTTDVDVSWLPNLDRTQVPTAPSATGAAECLKWLQLDYMLHHEFGSRRHHAQLNFGVCKPGSTEFGSGYGAEMVGIQDSGMLPIFLNYPFQEKLPAAYNLVQLGLDTYGLIRAGGGYTADGGHYPARRFPLGFAAIALDNADIKNQVGDGSFAEVQHYYRSARTGKPMFGRKTSIYGFWQWICEQGSGTKDARDPYGMIEGNRGYAKINAGAQRSYAAMSKLVPGLEALYPSTLWSDWVYRYNNEGREIPPSANCKQCPNNVLSGLGSTFGGGNDACAATGACTCITGTPTYTSRLDPEQHGNRSVETYGNQDGSEFWSAFQACAKSGNCPGAPPGSGDPPPPPPPPPSGELAPPVLLD